MRQDTPARVYSITKPKKKPTTDFDGRDVPALNAELWPISKVHDYPNNPRTHPPVQLALLSQILKKRGFDQAIVVDETGTILKGHGRKAAAILAGFDEVPVVIRSGLTETEKAEIRIEDNSLGLLSGWDKELMKGELSLIQTGGGDLSLLGFGEAQLVEFTTLPMPPDQFAQVGSDLNVDHQCPRCGFQGSGDWTPKKAKEKPKKKKK